MRLESLSKNPKTISEWQGHPLMKVIQMPYPGARDFWVLKDSENKTRGKIGAAVSMSRRQLGKIGFFDLRADDDVESASILLTQACSFLKSAGCERAVGPIHLNTWLPYRFALRREDSLRFSWEPQNPISYPELWRKNGFSREALYFSRGCAGFSKFLDRLKSDWNQARRQSYQFRAFRFDHLMEQEISLLHRLSMQGFQKNYLFEGLDFELFRELYIPILERSTGSNSVFIQFVLNAEGQEVGFAFSFIDLSCGVRRLVLKTATVLPNYRGKGLSNALFYESFKDLDASEIQEFVLALVLQGAQSECYGRDVTTLWQNDYELLGKSLSKS